MASMILLGTGAALSDATREHTYMVAQGASGAILLDCGGSPTQRLEKSGITLDQIDHVILTHHHPDHIYGVSVFLLDLWLAGRKRALHIYGLAETLRSTRAMMHAFEWERWFDHGFFPIEFHRVPKTPRHALIVTSDFAVFTSPTQHLLPTIATRIVNKASGQSLTYSSDTELCDAVAELATASDILIHEATTRVTPSLGHSSAQQAGEQAQRAGVKRLVLVHLPPQADPKAWCAAAQKKFQGKVSMGKDFGKLEF